MLARLVRFGLPLGLVVAGLVLVLVAGSTSLEAMGITLLGTGPIVFALNWFFRLSSDDAAAREREEAARRHYDEHGRWPDER